MASGKIEKSSDAIMSKVSASSLEELQTKITALANTMNVETSTELIIVATSAFGIFNSGTHSVTFHKLAQNYYWAYGYMQGDVITFAYADNQWNYQKINSRKSVPFIVNPNSSDTLPFAPNISVAYWYTSLDSCVPSAILGHDGNQWYIFDRQNVNRGYVSINNTTVTNATDLYIILIMSE